MTVLKHDPVALINTLRDESRRGLLLTLAQTNASQFLTILFLRVVYDLESWVDSLTKDENDGSAIITRLEKVFYG